MASFRDVLSKLFYRNVIITKTASGDLKLFDANQQQSTGNANMRYDRFRWKNSKGTRVGGSGYIPYGSGTGTDYEAQRLRLYGDYEMMENDSIISSALDIYADCGVTEDNLNDEILIITSPDPKVKKILYNLFYDVLNIEFNMWSWLRNLCKYGDFFLYLELQEKFGVTNVVPLHPSLVRRIEDLDESGKPFVRFLIEGASYPLSTAQQFYQEYEIAHFRLLTDTNFLPYGKSIVENCRKDFKMLMMMEEAMMLHRIMRAPTKRMFKIDIGSIAPDGVDSYIEDIVNSVKKVPYIDESTGDYNLKFNLQNMMEDFYLPVRGGDSGTTIETLDGLSNEGQIDDIEYFRSKIFASVKIPKAYMGYDEETDGKALLSAQDMRFSTTINRIQKIFVAELYKIANIHLLTQGFSASDVLDFELKMPNSSIIFQRQKVDLLNEQLNAVSAIIEKKLFSREYIYQNIFKMAPDEWKADQDRIIEDLKRSFREEQISSEGNDPKTSGKSFGTPHDLLAMQMAGKTSISPETEDKRIHNQGRPIEPGTYGTDHDKLLGRDPVGLKAINSQAYAAENSSYRMAHFNKINKLKSTPIKKDIITDSKKQNKPSRLAQLDENLLLNDEL